MTRASLLPRKAISEPCLLFSVPRCSSLSLGCCMPPEDSQPKASSNASASELEQTSAKDNPLDDEKVLTRVLLETISSTTSDQGVEAVEMEALRQIGRQYAGEELTLDPIATDLVGSILKCRLGDRWGPPERRETMSREIAGTLWHNPHTYDRLVSFWARLSEGSA